MTSGRERFNGRPSGEYIENWISAKKQSHMFTECEVVQDMYGTLHYHSFAYRGCIYKADPSVKTIILTLTCLLLDNIEQWTKELPADYVYDSMTIPERIEKIDSTIQTAMTEHLNEEDIPEQAVLLFEYVLTMQKDWDEEERFDIYDIFFGDSWYDSLAEADKICRETCFSRAAESVGRYRKLSDLGAPKFSLEKEAEILAGNLYIALVPADGYTADFETYYHYTPDGSFTGLPF